MTTGERIKQLRKELHITQADLGSKIGLKQAAIGLYENNQRTVTDRCISDICREFNVSEEWLRTGSGEMFNQRSTDEELAYIVGSAIPAASDYVKNTFIALGKLSKEFSKEDWEVVKKFVDALAGK